VFRLTTLGSPVLADGAGEEIRSVLAQSKQLAVLAYVATEGAQGFVRRDALLALFWPESDADAARQALRQTLYHLRRETAEDLFVARSADEIAINRDILWCDARPTPVHRAWCPPYAVGLSQDVRQLVLA
jgi:DNA-binding SARP family transcriptional activator